MNNLIKNELTKIFHKKALYVILIIMVVLIFVGRLIDKFLYENVEANELWEKEAVQTTIDSLDKSDPTYNEQLISLNSELEAIELSEKYDKNSWQTYLINNYGRDIIYEKNLSKGKDEYEENKKKYDQFIEKLQNNDWKAFAQEELDEKNSEIEQLKATENYDKETLAGLEDEKQVLTWRIEKNIEYGNDENLGIALEEWELERAQLRNYENKEKNGGLTYSEKYQKQTAIQTLELYKYQIENAIKDEELLSDEVGNYYIATSADSGLATVFSESGYGLFIIIATLIIAGTIVSEEFNKGTIKLLLVRPYKRTKILMSKFITCLIVLAIMYVAVFLVQFVSGGIFDGFGNYNFKVAIYSFNTNSVETINVFKYMLLNGAGILPLYVLLLTLAFALSTLFTNSAIAIALPLLGYMGSNIINGFAYNYKKAEFLKFFVTPNWNLNVFLFGKIPQFEPISLPFSIAICLLYFMIMMVVSLIVFNKKEIKNI